MSYVFAVSCDHPLVLGGASPRADAAFADLDQTAWQLLSCGEISLDEHGGEHQWRLARRSISDPVDLAF